jgi:Mrp family chromosome partitioning ATPase
MIVKKAYKMAEMMNIPVLGIVENMSYIQCPDCGKKLHVFGEGKSETIAEELGLPLLAQMPIDPSLATMVDNGCIEKADVSVMNKAVEILEKL